MTEIINELPIDWHMQVGHCPTAATAHRWTNCLDSWRLELFANSQREEVDDPGDERRERIMQALTKIGGAPEVFEKATAEMTLDEKTTVNACDAIYWQLLEQTFGDGEGVEVFEPRRYYMRQDGRNLTSARVDKIHFRRSDGLLLLPRFKTGAGEIDPPERNPNIQVALACIVHEMVSSGLAVNKATTALIQPLGTEPIRTHQYDKDGLVILVNAVLEAAIVSNTPAPEPRLKAGPWCEFCPAKALCPIRRQLITEVLSIQDKVATLDNSQLAEYLKQVKTVEAICKAIKEEALERLLDDELCLPGAFLEEKEEFSMTGKTGLDGLVKRYKNNEAVKGAIERFVKSVPRTSDKRTVLDPKGLIEALQAAGVSDKDLKRITTKMKEDK